MQIQDLPEDLQDLLWPLFSPEDKHSFSNLLPESMASCLLDSLAKEPRLIPYMEDEKRLLDFLYGEFSYKPTPTEERVRMMLWLEKESSIIENRLIRVNNLHSLICDYRSFKRMFTDKPMIVAFLLCKPMAYKAQVEEILSYGLRQMRRILEMPEHDAKGKLNTKLLELKLRVTAMMDLRISGAPKQSIQQLNLNVNADAQKGVTAADVKTLVQKGDYNTIRKRLEEIERRSGGLEVLEAELVQAKGNSEAT